MKVPSIVRAPSAVAKVVFFLTLVPPILSHADAFNLITNGDPRLTPANVLTLQQDGFTQVVIDGYIHQPTVDAFRKEVSSGAAQFGIVYLNSAGGDLIAAQELGRLIRAKGYATQIGKLTDDQRQITRGVCESACPIAFVGGKFRLLDANTGQLGIHRFYLAKNKRWSADSAVLFTAERDLRSYLDEMGIDPEFLEVMMRTPADTILAIDKRSSYVWKLGTGSEVASWQLTTTGVLKGEGETSTGAMGLTFSCAGHSVQAQARFKPWFPPTALLNYETHSITVNGTKYPVQEVHAGYDKQSGFITFDTTLAEEALKALPTAERVGYALSFDNQPGEYSRALSVQDGGKALAQVVKNCSDK